MKEHYDPFNETQQLRIDLQSAAVQMTTIEGQRDNYRMQLDAMRSVRAQMDATNEAFAASNAALQAKCSQLAATLLQICDLANRHEYEAEEQSLIVAAVQLANSAGAS